MTEKEWLGNNQLSLDIWHKKYQMNGESFDEWVERIGGSLKEVKNLIRDKKFLFGGRILASRGITDRRVTYSNCFTGDTVIMTDKGLRSLLDCYNYPSELKVLSNGAWREAKVEYFGEQEVKLLTLRRGKTIRTFKVTGNHQWFVKNKKGKTILKQTNELCVGDIIPTEVLKCYRTYKPNPIGVAHGFFTGDGDHVDKKNLRINICKGKEELLPYFTPDTIGHSGDTITISSMPKFFLNYPDLNESKSYLYGWLAGYFAADGSIDLRGSCVICSTNKLDLKYVQHVLCVLGIPCEEIREQTRISNLNGKSGTVFILNLNKKYLNENFFIRKEHRDRFINNPFKKDTEWKVDNLEDTDSKCPVFCAIVPETQSFTLEGGIKTHNCYVIAPPKDNIESIFETASKLARTYSYGGGCGVDISNLRPKDAVVHNAAKSTSGAVSFMDLYSYVTGLIGQSGRRGALMISISCEHPDIEEFINLKTKPGVCEKANISIRVTDAFMQAAINDENWVAVFSSEETGTITKTFKAKELLKLLAKRNWEWAEPGLLYWDRITGYNMLSNDDRFSYAGVNPCAEEPLPAGGSCLLGSINLSEFVIDPFTEKARVDFDSLEKAVAIAVAGLNQVLNEGASLHPLEEQRNSVSQWRQIGLGTMGLADMFIKLGVTYGSELSITVADSVYKTIATTAVETSLELAKRMGCYPMCDKEKLADSSFIKALNLPENTLGDIRKYGLFNSQLLTCAPTGSIATMLQVSTGVEPNFALKYVRKTQSLNGKDTFYEVNAKIVVDYYDSFSINGKFRTSNILPDYFVESKDITPIDRIKMQAVLQKYTDASISSTINLPKEATVEDVYNIYVEAWKHGLKGVTVYRSGCYREGILMTKKPDNIPVTSAPKRPVELPCEIHKVKVKGENFIVCVGMFEEKPYEVFVFRLINDISITEPKGVIIKRSKGVYKLKSKDMEIANLLNTDISIEEKAATLYSSMLLRHGVNIKYIIKTAKKVNDNISSFSSAMCRVLAKYIPSETEGKCPECGADLVHEGGCIHCSQCSYSKCE